MKTQFAVAVVVVAALAVPLSAQAQGIIGGGQQGVAMGQKAAGPVGAVVGGVVGGAVGAVVGGVKGVIGVPQEPAPVVARPRRTH